MLRWNSVFVLVACVALNFTLGRAVGAVEIPGWGTIVNPDGDCTINLLAPGKLEIRVPGNWHDLWFGGKDVATRFNAPRVLREIEGDFVATVQVTADWDSGLDGGGYNGAGLVIWDSEKQYLRMERNRYVPAAGREAFSYIAPMYDQNDRRVYNRTTPDQFFTGRSTWLTAVRRGKIISTSVHDGQKWISTGVVSTEFPPKVKVGVLVLNSTKREFVVEFQSFKVDLP